MDIPGDIRVRVAEGSHTPETDQDKIQKAQLGITLGVGTGTLPPETDRYMGGLLNLPEMTGKYKDWATKGQKRLDEIIETAKMAEQMMTERGVEPQLAEQFIAQECAQVGMSLIDPFDNHEILIQFYKGDIPVSDFYDDLSPAVKQALMQVVQAHEMGGVAEMQKQTAKQVAATEPAREAQKADAMEQQGMQQEAEQAGQGAEQEKAATDAEREDQRTAIDAQKEVATKALDADQAERQRQHEATEADKQRKHEKELAVIAARSKPKGERK